MNTTLTPKRKVGAGALAGALTTLLVFLLGQHGTAFSPEAAAALTVLLTFGASYLVPEE